MTGRVIPLHGDRHQKIQSLLPWYVAGGLSDDERAEVRAHLDGCADCQARLRDETRLASDIVDLPLGEGGRNVEHGWRLMSLALEQEARGRRPLGARIASLARRIGEALRPRPGEAAWLRWAVAAQFSLILVLGALAWRPDPPAAYKALGAAPETPAANLIVVFRPETPERDIRAILRSSNARLVDGPTATDAYLLHVPPPVRSAALLRLRKQAQIVLAEPLDGGGAGR